MSWDESKHPRVPAGSSEGGQFTDKGGGGGRATAAARRAAGLKPERGGAMLEALREGGFSESLAGDTPKGGYMTAVTLDSEFSKPIDEFTLEDILDYVTQYAEELSQPDTYVGGWLDEGIGYLDISKNFQDLNEALSAAKAGNQLAIWDVENFVSIYLEELEEARR